MVMKKAYFFVIVAAVWAILTALSQPPTAHRQESDPEPPIFAGTPASSEILSIFTRSCQNCHSTKTEWPVYSRVYPMSALIQHDVRAARSHLDLSHWQSYDDAEKRLHLSEIGSAVRNGIMPPARYTLLHPEAKLSAAEVREIYLWTRSTRSALQHGVRP